MPKKPAPFRARNWTEADIPALMECQSAAYADYEEPHYDSRIFELQLAAFPEGQFLVEEVATGRVVGYACAIIVAIDDDLPWFTWSEITGDGTFKTHDPSGDTLYGADIAVHPDFRGQGVAALLYRERKRILQRYNLRRMVAHGRIPGYRAVAGKMTPDEYIKRVRDGELKDLALNAHLKAGYTVRRVFQDYVQDPASLDFSTLIEYENPRFNPDKRRVAVQPLRRPVRRIRVCLAQFYMRRVNSWAEFEQNIDFFVDTADIYHCHFLVFPELFTAQLFSLVAPDLPDREAIREVAAMTDQYIELFRDRAMKNSLYIIGGSQPVLRDGILYNTAHLFTPGGKVFTQDKLHITPSERRVWDIQPGDKVQLFDTPLGRIGIQICYDVEFPELARIMAMAGAEVLFVPFSTDEKKAYYRVRHSAQARAVENYMYVVIAGNVGNLPSVRSYLINYAESAILTPSDFSYPVGGVQAEADPNVETVVIGDLDLSSLTQQRDLASVQPLMDRRIDLYDVKARQPIQIVRVD
ncbi:MAG: bifunctional GNAT family N-acetyltransferase/carbon-nitrogen hydrolase family protein [Spirochaetales bacterium]|nr:bifunctional GNAT family N-acetyltransferase/carbon-nitrogen hydrolase family protein [Leptospiraceae bacterium]MCP5480887.1 bifunctional GNAT family N-acetyltransferase/carbon-nitrogen hydrolase family protein [Spirochaetales bacterium]